MVGINDNTVSVIIPSFNSENTVARCLQSVSAQSFSNLEIIFVDDCSSDGSLDVASELAVVDHRIKIIRHDSQKGVSSARNTGLDESLGRLVIFLDSDDYLQPWYLREMVESLEDFDLVASAFALEQSGIAPQVRNHGMRCEQSLNQASISSYLDDYFLQPYVYTLFVHCWNKLFLRDKLNKNRVRFDEGLSQLEDVHFVAQYLRYADSVRYIESPGYIQTRNSEGGNLSVFSGMGGRQAVADCLCALRVIGEVKSELDGIGKHYLTISYSHFISSMTMLFCLRMARQFRRCPSLSTLVSIYAWISSRRLRDHFYAYKRVAGESHVLRFSLKYLPPSFFVPILILASTGR